MSNSVKRLPKWIDIKVPQMRCDEHCGECCGPVVCSETEMNLIQQFCESNEILLRNGDPLTCGFYQKGRCAVYPVRPFLCRLFGHVPGMVCERGYNRNISAGKERKFLDRYDKKTENCGFEELNSWARKQLSGNRGIHESVT